MMISKQSVLMAINVAGHHSSLKDDPVKLMRLLRSRFEMVESAIQQSKGNITIRNENCYFVTFTKPLDALHCAFSIESKDTERQKDESELDKIHLQIGLHYGSVSLSGDKPSSDFLLVSEIAERAGVNEVAISDDFFKRFASKFSLRAERTTEIQSRAISSLVKFHTVNPVHLSQKSRFVNKKTVSIGAILGALGVLFAFLGALFEGAQTDFVVNLFRKESATTVKQEDLSLPSPNLNANRVAVMPLRNLTGDDRQAYIAEGLAENLSFRLSQIRELYVYPLSDVLSLYGENKTIRQISNALGCKYLVQGSFSQDGDSLIVFLEIIDTETLNKISSDRLTSINSDMRGLQQNAARTILYPIVGRVSGEAEAALAAFASTNSLAGDLYLQARKAQRDAITWEDQQKVIRLYESAVAADEHFALAKAHLSTAYATVYGTWQNDTLWVKKAMEQAQAAVKLSPDLPEAHFALGEASTKSLDYVQAESSYRKAVLLRPDYREPRDAMGSLYNLVGKIDEAALLFGQSLELSRTFGDRRGEANALNEIGNIYEGKSELDKALETFQLVLEIRSEIEDRRGEARIIHNIAQIHYRKSDYGKALELLSTALSINREIGNRVFEARNLLSIGNINAEQHNYENAIQVFIESREILHSIGDRITETGALANIGAIYSIKGEFHKSLEILQTSLEAIREVGDRKGEANALLNIGSIYRRLNNNDKALVYYQDCLDMCREIGDRQREAMALGQMGVTYANMGEYDIALERHKELVPIFREMGDRRGEALTHSQIGINSTIKANYTEAIQSFNEQLQIDNEIGNRRHIANGNCRLGEVYRFMNEFEKANEFYEKAVEIYGELENTSGNCWANVCYGKLLYDTGDYENAKLTIKKMIDDPLADIDDRIEAQVYMGACLVRLGSVNDGIKMIEIATDSLRTFNMIVQTVEAHRIMGDVLQFLGRGEEADRHFDTGMALANEKGLKVEIELIAKRRVKN